MIPEFYENCDIFMTGGSGIVGKALIEKLLRSCNVRKIYILLRSKKNANCEERLKIFHKEKIFRLLHSQKPYELNNKLVAIPGDVALPNLGITADYAKLLENVSIVFHCAATTRFDEPIKKAIRLNVGGTLEVLRLAQTFKKLKIFMHVSTFFSNPYLPYIESKLYSPPIDWKIALQLCDDNSNEYILDTLTRKLIMGFPNTYSFTKNLAESLVNDYRDRLPIGVFKPAIVVAALSEPEKGFTPNLVGATGLFAAVAAGVLKTTYTGDVRMNLTPLDFGTKSLIYYAVKAADDYRNANGKLNSVPVYLFSIHESANFTFKDICNIANNTNILNEAVPLKSLLIPGCHYTSCRFVYMFLVITKQIFPALLVDVLLRLFGKEPIAMAIARKSFLSLEVMTPFTFNNFACSGITNYDTMMKETNGTEFEMEADIKFCTDLTAMKYITDVVFYKMREVIFDEGPETLPLARRLLKIKFWLYYILHGIVFYFTINWLYGRIFN